MEKGVGDGTNRGFVSLDLQDAAAAAGQQRQRQRQRQRQQAIEVAGSSSSSSVLGRRDRQPAAYSPCNKQETSDYDWGYNKSDEDGVLQI